MVCEWGRGGPPFFPQAAPQKQKHVDPTAQAASHAERPAQALVAPELLPSGVEALVLGAWRAAAYRDRASLDSTLGASARATWDPPPPQIGR